MSAIQNWTVRDIVERITRDGEQEVGFFLPWCEWYAKVDQKQAISILDRNNPNVEFSVNIVGGTLFIGEKKV